MERLRVGTNQLVNGCLTGNLSTEMTTSCKEGRKDPSMTIVMKQEACELASICQ